MTQIQACSCRHEQQDRWYGRGMRVHNQMKDGRACCTVCGNEKGAAVKSSPKSAPKAK